MSETWKSVKASEISTGDTVRLPSGVVVDVARVEASFLGRPGMLAFIEDTPERWFKCVSPADGDVDVLVTTPS